MGFEALAGAGGAPRMEGRDAHHRDGGIVLVHHHLGGERADV